MSASAATPPTPNATLTGQQPTHKQKKECDVPRLVICVLRTAAREPDRSAPPLTTNTCSPLNREWAEEEVVVVGREREEAEEAAEADADAECAEEALLFERLMERWEASFSLCRGGCGWEGTEALRLWLV